MDASVSCCLASDPAVPVMATILFVAAVVVVAAFVFMAAILVMAAILFMARCHCCHCYAWHEPLSTACCCCCVLVTCCLLCLPESSLLAQHYTSMQSASHAYALDLCYASWVGILHFAHP